VTEANDGVRLSIDLAVGSYFSFNASITISRPVLVAVEVEADAATMPRSVAAQPLRPLAAAESLLGGVLEPVGPARAARRRCGPSTRRAFKWASRAASLLVVIRVDNIPEIVSYGSYVVPQNKVRMLEFR
jgi:hypothetical protein